jgi:hypothetical protein
VLDIAAVEHQQIERAGDRCVIHDPAVQCIELCNAIGIEPHHLSVDDGASLEAGSLFDNARGYRSDQLAAFMVKSRTRPSFT